MLGGSIQTDVANRATEKLLGSHRDARLEAAVGKSKDHSKTLDAAVGKSKDLSTCYSNDGHDENINILTNQLLSRRHSQKMQIIDRAVYQRPSLS